MAAVKDKEYHVRYFTYCLYFPKDKDVWQESIPFIHALSFELPNTTFGKNPIHARNLLNKGATDWTDHNGVRHVVKITNDPVEKIWGVKRNFTN